MSQTFDEEIFQLSLEEGRQSLDDLETRLLALEAGTLTGPAHLENLDAMFRSAHNFKGASASVGLEQPTQVAHAIEDLLTVIKHGHITIDRARCSIMLKAIDVLRKILTEISTNPSFRMDVLPVTEHLRSAILEQSGPTQPGQPKTTSQNSVSRPKVDRGRRFQRCAKEGGMSKVARVSPHGAELKKLVLIIEDDEFVRAALGREMERLGFECRQASDLSSARILLQSVNPYDLVLSDIHLPDGNALDFLKSMKANAVHEKPGSPWIFITGDPNPDLVKKSTEAGGIDLLRKPFSRSDLRTLLERLSSRNQNPWTDINKLIEELSGIRLGEQKRMLVEGRVHQRAREPKLNGVEAYLSYFKIHRSEEAQALLSLVSTHTTEFFREPDHFKFLCDHALPELFASGRPIRIWSAACSSGDEVYSIAMAIHARRLSGPPHSHPSLNSGLPMQIDIIGTDLDPRSVKKASNGVYPCLKPL